MTTLTDEQFKQLTDEEKLKTIANYFSHKSIESLNKNISKSLYFGYIALGLSVIASMFLYHFIQESIEKYASWFKDETHLLLFLTLRFTALASVSGLIIYFLVGLTKASLDQSARSTKRLNSALYLSSFMSYIGKEMLEDKIKLTDIQKFFESWNQSIESAYTNTKTNPTKLGQFKISGNKDGFNFET